MAHRFAGCPQAWRLGLILGTLGASAAACDGGAAVGTDSALADDAAANDAAVQGPIIADGTFEITAFDTGNLVQRCTMMAPAGSNSWGVNAATFTVPGDPTIDTARFMSDGHQGYLYGLENRGRFGFTRYIQGDVWGGGNCGPIVWRTFDPVPTFGKQIDIDIDVYRDTNNVFSTQDGWMMFALNLWFSTPDLPKPGGDLNHRKPLVMDLAMHVECGTPPCHLADSEDNDAYHYQALVGDLPFHAFKKTSINLSQHIQAAVAHFGLPAAAAQTLKLYQVEFLIELRHAEAAASIDNYVIRVQ